MNPRSRFSSRLTLWAFAAALLLKSAVPLLAAGAAALQGRPVAEICDVYGVDTSAGARPARATATQAARHHEHGHDEGAHAAAPDAAASAGNDAGDEARRAPPSHGLKAGDHCALSGLVAMASGESAAMAALVRAAGATARVIRVGSVVFDAAAQWAARLEHGPPARA